MIGIREIAAGSCTSCASLRGVWVRAQTANGRAVASNAGCEPRVGQSNRASSRQPSSFLQPEGAQPPSARNYNAY